MPKVAKGKRQRAYRPKTRSGCLTCKSIKIKLLYISTISDCCCSKTNKMWRNTSSLSQMYINRTNLWRLSCRPSHPFTPFRYSLHHIRTVFWYPRIATVKAGLCVLCTANIARARRLLRGQFLGKAGSPSCLSRISNPPCHRCHRLAPWATSSVSDGRACQLLCVGAL